MTNASARTALFSRIHSRLQTCDLRKDEEIQSVASWGLGEFNSALFRHLFSVKHCHKCKIHWQQTTLLRRTKDGSRHLRDVEVTKTGCTETESLVIC
jgi:hypothetical protein